MKDDAKPHFVRWAMDELILKAAQLAKRAHAGQVRKYHEREYIEHPARVAARAMLLDDVTSAEIAAAWLHDVVEDCGYTADDLRRAGMPQETVTLVLELTNPSKQYSQLPRAERKRIDRDHLRTVSREAKRIKLIDRIDNLRDVQQADNAFKSLYAAESLALAECLTDVDDQLLEQLFQAIEELGFSREYRDPSVS